MGGGCKLNWFNGNMDDVADLDDGTFRTTYTHSHRPGEHYVITTGKGTTTIHGEFQIGGDGEVVVAPVPAIRFEYAGGLADFYRDQERKRRIARKELRDKIAGFATRIWSRYDEWFLLAAVWAVALAVNWDRWVG